MFTHNFDPAFLSFGSFEIRYYGLVWVLGFLLVYYFLNKARKEERLEISKDNLESYMLYLILGVFFGARLFHVIFSEPSFYFSNPLKIFAFWEGGVAFHGGLVGALLVSYYFVKKHSISLLKLGDVIVVPMVLVLALGRITNFINGELYGVATDVSWCVNFPNISECRHPTQLYESLANFFIFGILFLNKKRKEGTIFWMFVLLMGVTRFLISFLRVDVKFLSLSDGQYFSLVMIIIGVYFLWIRKNGESL